MWSPPPFSHPLATATYAATHVVFNILGSGTALYHHKLSLWHRGHQPEWPVHVAAVSGTAHAHSKSFIKSLPR